VEKEITESSEEAVSLILLLEVTPSDTLGRILLLYRKIISKRKISKNKIMTQS
jgi:hypothetical protein